MRRASREDVFAEIAGAAQRQADTSALTAAPPEPDAAPPPDPFAKLEAAAQAPIEPTAYVNFRVPRSLKRRIDRFCAEKGWSLQGFGTACIESALERLGATGAGS